MYGFDHPYLRIANFLLIPLWLMLCLTTLSVGAHWPDTLAAATKSVFEILPVQTPDLDAASHQVSVELTFLSVYAPIAGLVLSAAAFAAISRRPVTGKGPLHDIRALEWEPAKKYIGLLVVGIALLAFHIWQASDWIGMSRSRYDFGQAPGVFGMAVLAWFGTSGGFVVGVSAAIMLSRAWLPWWEAAATRERLGLAGRKQESPHA